MAPPTQQKPAAGKPQTSIEIQRAQANTLAAAILEKRAAFAQVAPKHLNVERMIKLAQASISRTPKLAQCTVSSVLTVLMRSAELGLEPNSALGGMWLIPYENKKTGKVECQGIIDYRALVELARRSGEIAAIFAEVRCENDKWKRTLGTDPSIIHEPAEDEDRGDVMGFYAVAKLKSGEVQFAYMTKKDVDLIRSRSRASSSGPWVTDYNEMAKKTVLRRLCKMLPLQSQVKEQLSDEEAIDRGEAPGPVIDVMAEDMGHEIEAGVAGEVAKKLAAGKPETKSSEKPADPPPPEDAPPQDETREPGQEG